MSGPNRSSAVMQQRHEAPDSLDDFPTPLWATRALCEWLKFKCAPGPFVEACEPAANRLYMAKVLSEYFAKVHAFDCHDYGVGCEVRDYLFGDMPTRVWLTATNPPFRLALEFVLRALSHSQNVAVLLRSAFAEGDARYAALFEPDPPSDILQFSERVVMWKGCLLDPDVPITRWSKKKDAYVTEKPASATAYSWFVWREGRTGKTAFHWIPPGTRKRLTRPGDYPPLPEHLLPRQSAPGLFEGVT